MRFLKQYAMTCRYGSPSALFTFYVDIASESDVVEPGDDMPRLCPPMAERAKLMCRRRLGSFLSKPFVCFEGLSDIVRKRRTNKQRWRISGKASFSLAGVANERINDSHAQREREASEALHISALHSTRHVGPRCPDEAQFAKLKIVSPTAMAKLAIDIASLEFLVINREIFIQNREIGRFSVFLSKIGRSPAKSGDLEALKTHVSLFHLRNRECGKQLNISSNGMNLTHCNLPVYLGVTLDRTLS